LTGFIDAFDATRQKALAILEYSAERRSGTRQLGGRFGRLRWQPYLDDGTYDVETNTLFWTTGNPGPIMTALCGLETTSIPAVFSRWILIRAN